MKTVSWARKMNCMLDDLNKGGPYDFLRTGGKPKI